MVVDVAYTETAALADYVLPAASQHEKWEFTLFTFEWPTNYFQLRRPLLDPLPGTLVEAEIYTRLFDALGVLPPSDVLASLAAGPRAELQAGIGALVQAMPERAAILPVLLYRTLGASLPDGAASIAPLWAGLSPRGEVDDRAGAACAGQLVRRGRSSGRSCSRASWPARRRSRRTSRTRCGA